MRRRPSKAQRKGQREGRDTNSADPTASSGRFKSRLSGGNEYANVCRVREESFALRYQVQAPFTVRANADTRAHFASR